MRILRRYTVRFRGGKTRFVGRVLALHGGFHAAQAGFQCADAVAEHIGQRLLVQVVRRAGLAAAHADHFGRNTDRGGIGRQIFEHHTARADTDIIPDIHRAKHLGTGTDQHVIAQCGVALAGILAGAAQGNAVVDGAVITDFCRFAEHDAHTVVNEQPVADLGTGVDLDAGQVAGQLADEARQEETLVTVQKMCNFVRYQHMETGVQNDDLRHIACSRVLVPDVFCVCPKSHPTYLISVCVLSRISKENTRIS